jgi:hypothetical protein
MPGSVTKIHASGNPSIWTAKVPEFVQREVMGDAVCQSLTNTGILGWHNR